MKSYIRNFGPTYVMYAKTTLQAHHVFIHCVDKQNMEFLRYDSCIRFKKLDYKYNNSISKDPFAIVFFSVAMAYPKVPISIQGWMKLTLS